MSSESKDILEGFNAGYVMRQKRPQVYKQLEKEFEELDLPFFKSFIEGGKAYLQELKQSKIERIQQLKDSPSKNRDISLDR